MKMTKTSVTGTVEILAADEFTAIPITVTESDVVKAGMPMLYAGTKVEAGTGANGILLYDVDPSENPNGALLVAGVVDWTKCKSNSGATADATTMKTALPAIEFRENIGVNE